MARVWLATLCLLAWAIIGGPVSAAPADISAGASSPPFALYLGPRFIPPDSGAVSEATGPPFELYLGPGYGPPSAGGLSSANSPAFALYLGPGFRAPPPGTISAATSAAFPLYLGVLREGFAQSAPFALDTRLANAIVGTIQDGGAGGTPLAGVLVELFLGSTRMGSTTTDGTGSYRFFATVPGAYVVRSSKGGFRDATTDLLRFSGNTVAANLSMVPLAGLTPLADLVVQAADLTYTSINTGTLTLTAMVHNEGGTPASSVRVRFFDASTGSGVSQYIIVPGDQTIASLAPGEAKPVSVNWVPPSGHRRFYAFADPNDQIRETTNLNNGAAKDLGVYSGSAPRVVSAASEFDGLDSPLQMGSFLSGVTGGLVRFNATVSDPDADVAKVTFDFDGKIATDQNADDGWSVWFDPGTLAAGTRPLTLIAYDRTGLSSEPFHCQLVVDAQPAWTVGALVDAGPLGGGVEYKDGYLNYTLRLRSSAVGQGEREPLFVEVTPDRDVVLIGETKTKFEVGVYFTLGKPLRPTMPWRISGVVKRTEQLFNRDMSSDDIAVSASLSPDGQHLLSVGLDYNGSVSVGTPEVMVPVGSIGPVPVSLGVSADLVLAVHAFGTFATDLTSYELGLDPSVGAQINGIARVGVKYANLQAVLSPRLAFGLQLRYLHPPDELTTSGKLDFDVTGKVVGTLGKKPFQLSGDLLKFKLGPWSKTIFGPSEVGINDPASAADSVNLAGPFPSPASASGADGRVGVTYVADGDPSPEVTSPEIFFAERDTSGTWGAPSAITASGLFKSAPAVVYTAQGEPVVVWVQNSTPVEQIPSDASLGWLLDHQDLWWSRRSAGGWSAPAPLMADTPEAPRADGLPVLAALPAGATAIWSRSPVDSALAGGSAELFASQLDGAGWSAPVALTSDQVDDVEPSVCGLRGDSTLVVWLRQDPSAPEQGELFWQLGNAGAWANPTPLQGQTGALRSPMVARVAGHGALVVWVALETAPDSTLFYRLMASRFDETTGLWDAPAEVHHDSHFIESPIARVDARGIAAIVWRGYAGQDGELMVALEDLSRAGGSWTSPRLLTEDTLTDWMSTAVVDGQNNLHVIDLKTDLNMPQAGVQSAGNFVGGLSLASRGISRDATMSDGLNFGFRPLSADLRIQRGAVSLANAAAKVGDVVLALARIENIGDSRSAESTVRFYDGPPDSGGVPLAGVPADLPPIEPDSAVTVAVPWVVEAGEHRLFAVADPDNLVPEQTESNNRSSIALGFAPDLSLDSIRVSDDNPAPGVQISALAYVRNIGGAASPGFTVSLSMGAGAGSEATSTALAPNEARIIALPFSGSEGVDTLAVVVDPDSSTGDSRYANNRGQFILKVLPDLALPADSIAYSPSDSSISAVVVNLGGVPSGAFDLGFYAGNPLVAGARIGLVGVAALAPGDARRVSVPWRASLGATTIYAIADSAGVIVERERGNNMTYLDVIQGALPDLALVPGSIELQIDSGPTFTLSVKLVAQGAANALAVGVEFFRGEPEHGGTLVGDQLLPSIAVGETLEVSVPWLSPDSVTNPVTVVVNRSGSLAELRSDNNRDSRLFGPVLDTPKGPLFPTRVGLHSARPNPFTGATEIAFDLPSAGPVKLEVYDVAGRLVRVLATGIWAPGFHSVRWSGDSDRGRPLPAGVYFTRLRVGGSTIVRRVVLL